MNCMVPYGIPAGVRENHKSQRVHSRQLGVSSFQLVNLTGGNLHTQPYYPKNRHYHTHHTTLLQLAWMQRLQKVYKQKKKSQLGTGFASYSCKFSEYENSSFRKIMNMKRIFLLNVNYLSNTCVAVKFQEILNFLLYFVLYWFMGNLILKSL